MATAGAHDIVLYAEHHGNGRTALRLPEARSLPHRQAPPHSPRAPVPCAPRLGGQKSMCTECVLLRYRSPHFPQPTRCCTWWWPRPRAGATEPPSCRRRRAHGVAALSVCVPPHLQGGTWFCSGKDTLNLLPRALPPCAQAGGTDLTGRQREVRLPRRPAVRFPFSDCCPLCRRSMVTPRTRPQN